MGRSLSVLSLAAALCCALLSLPAPTVAGKPRWIRGRITWYGQPSGAGVTAGSCGYGNTLQRGYGYDVAAASGTLYYGGKGCGACYMIKCRSHSTCNGKTFVVTVTNNCPSNWNLDANHGGWCNPPNRHLDLSYYAFGQVADPMAGVVPAFLRRVPCKRDGGVTFSLFGNPWFIMVLVSNIAGSGDIDKLYFRVGGDPWKALWLNNGAIWTIDGGGFYGKSITVKIKSKYSHQKLVIPGAIPASWSFGGDYKTSKNFPAF